MTDDIPNVIPGNVAVVKYKRKLFQLKDQDLFYEANIFIGIDWR